MGKVKNCSTCEFGCYNELKDCVCVNDKSEYVADFVNDNFCCEVYEEKRGRN